MATKAKQIVEDDDIFQNFETIKFEEPKFKPYTAEKMSDEELQYIKLAAINDDDWCF